MSYIVIHDLDAPKIMKKGKWTKNPMWTIDYKAFEEVYYYFDLVIALLENRLKPEDLVNKAEKHDSLMSAISAATLENIGIGTRIFH